MSMPMSTTVDVALQPSAGVTSIVQNPNQILLATSDSNGVSTSPYKLYSDLASVRKDFGYESKTAKTATALFTQNPNFLQAKGLLVIAPMLNAVSATSTIATLALGNKAAKLKLVTNGGIKITIDGQAFDLRNLNFTLIQDTSSSSQDVGIVVAQELQRELARYATVTASGGSNCVISSNTFGVSSTVVVASLDSIPTGVTDLSTADYFDIANIATVAGKNSTGESIPQLVTRLLAGVNPPVFYTTISTLDLEDAALLAVGGYYQSLPISSPRMFVYTLHSILQVTGTNPIAKQIITLGYSYLRLLYNDNADYAFAGAYVGRLCSVDIATVGSYPNCIAGNVTLVGMPSASDVSASVVSEIQTNGADAYYDIAGTNSIIASGANGGNFNSVYSFIYLTLEIQIAGDTLLRKSGVGGTLFTEQGRGNLLSTIKNVCITGKSNKMITEGLDWEGQMPVGIPASKEEAFRDCILKAGYYVYVAPLSSVSAQDRANGVSPMIIIAVKITQGFQKIIVRGTVQY